MANWYTKGSVFPFNFPANAKMSLFGILAMAAFMRFAISAFGAPLFITVTMLKRMNCLVV